MEKLDIYNVKRKLQLAQDNVRSSPRISESNKQDISAFNEYCFAEGLGVERVIKYTWTLKRLAEDIGKDFRTAKKQDIIKLVANVEARKISAWTKHDYRITLRKFFRWLRNKPNPQEVSWIKIGNGVKNHKLPEELLTEKDVERLIKAARDVQIKALVAVLWEGGFRVGELLSLRIKHVELEERLGRLVVDGKTGMRRVAILLSLPYLTRWLNLHPCKEDPSSPLWLQRNGKPLNYPDVRNRLQDLARKAGIKKKVNPHGFRHARATFLSQHFTEAQLSQYLGWIPGTKMAAVYVHLSGRDLEEPLLKLYGLQKEETLEESRLKPVQCWKCKTVNPADAVVCVQCGMFLKVEHAVAAEEKQKSEMDEIRRDIRTLKSMLVGPAPNRFRTSEELESIITSQKQLIEELRTRGLVTTIDAKK
jgi:site-specific recombinase XerD